MSCPLPRITLYSKPDCHLCEIAKERVENVRLRYPVTVETIDITSDPVLFEAYGERIPVVLLNGEEAYCYRVSEKGLARKIQDLSTPRSLWKRLLFWSS